MRDTAGTIDTASIYRLMNDQLICDAVARLHVDASAAAVIAHIAPMVARFERSGPRDIFYFAAACVSRHYSNRAAYTVAMRAAV